MLTTAHLRRGLNALARAAAGDYFADGHRGGAMVSGYYLCKESAPEPGVAELLAAAIDRQWSNTDLCAEFPDQAAQPNLAQGLVDAMLANTTGLRQAGHNIILPTLALKGFGHCPQAITPARLDGLCQLVASFTQVEEVQSDEAIQCPDSSDFTPFAEFVLAEFVDCTERFQGRGQGWSGHLLTYARALIDLQQMGLSAVADKAKGGFESYLRRIHLGPLERDIPRKEHQPKPHTPLQADYWKAQSGDWNLGHVLKYPYGFYGLVEQAENPKLLARCFDVAYRIF